MLKKTLENYRMGVIGAMLDEYERALFELKSILHNISEDDYTRTADYDTQNEDCRSIQTVISHVIRAGYSYSNYIRQQISIDWQPIENKLIGHQESGDEIDRMFVYTTDLYDRRWKIMNEEMIDEEINNSVIKTRWGITYNIDQLLEHAVVHILKHRRQIERFLLKFESQALSNRSQASTKKNC